MASIPAEGDGTALPATVWSRTAEARRFGWEILVVVVLKVALLVLLWYFAIRPQHRAEQSPQALAKHLVAAPAPAAPRP